MQALTRVIKDGIRRQRRKGYQQKWSAVAQADLEYLKQKINEATGVKNI